MVILMVGGTGFIGKALTQFFEGNGITVIVLTRQPKKKNHRFWDPLNKQVDAEGLRDVTHIINLNGAGIAEKRWTPKRKRLLYTSRIEATAFLFDLTKSHCPNLKQYIGISGINAFGFSDKKEFQESDSFGRDFLSALVFAWEQAHLLFESRVNTTIIRLGMVIDSSGGAYVKMAKPIRYGVGSIIGSGKQLVPWISLEDVVGLINYVSTTKKNIPSLIHGVAAHSTLKEIIDFIAFREGKKIRLPNVPEFFICLLFGSMGQLLTSSLRVSNESLVKSGYNIKNTKLNTIYYA